MRKKKKDYKNVYQFKIFLEGIQPLIWRRIQVPENYSFWDLHVAIQDAMGWFDGHLHQFSTIEKAHRNKQYIGIPDDDFVTEILPGWQEKISDWFDLEKRTKMNYEYDFGDWWRHKVELEKILPAEDTVSYPLCLTGKRACPPEDCGGIHGYYDIIRISKEGPKSRNDKEIMEWLGDDFDPECFDLLEIEFDNPAKRLRTLKEYF